MARNSPGLLASSSNHRQSDSYVADYADGRSGNWRSARNGMGATRNSVESLSLSLSLSLVGGRVRGVETRRAPRREDANSHTEAPLANASESRRNSKRVHKKKNPPFLFLTSGSLRETLLTRHTVGSPLWTNRFLDGILLQGISDEPTFLTTRGLEFSFFFNGKYNIRIFTLPENIYSMFLLISRRLIAITLVKFKRFNHLRWQPIADHNERPNMTYHWIEIYREVINLLFALPYFVLLKYTYKLRKCYKFLEQKILDVAWHVIPAFSLKLGSNCLLDGIIAPVSEGIHILRLRERFKIVVYSGLAGGWKTTRRKNVRVDRVSRRRA